MNLSEIFNTSKTSQNNIQSEARGFTWKRRSAFYTHIATQVENGVPIKSALQSFMPRLVRANTKDARRVLRIVQSVQSNMDNGYSFAEALKDYAPNEEIALISSGELAGRLHESLELVVVSQERITRVKKAAINAMVTPAIYSVVVFLFLWMVGAMIVPALIQALPQEKATGSVWALYVLGNFANSFWALIPVMLIIAAIFWVRRALPRWTGANRIKAEAYLPFSFYRDINGFSWLMGFAALLRAGITDVKIFEFQLKGATPWLRERLGNYHQMMQEGKSLPEALIAPTKKHLVFGFPNPDIVDDITSFDGFPDFPEKITGRARKWATALEEDTQAFAKRAGFMVEIFLYVIMIFLVYASSELSNQLANLPGMN